MVEPQCLRDMRNDGPLLLTPEEAAEALRIGRTTVYALIKAGDLRPVHIGRSCRLSRAELERYVDRLESVPSNRPHRHRETGTDDSGPRGGCPGSRGS
jgi:excisionase family DNA binding protein